MNSNLILRNTIIIIYIVALTKTEKRTTRDHKAAYIEQVRQSIDQHNTLYLFSYENMRSNHFQNVRLFFRAKSSSSADATMNDNEINDTVVHDSRIFLGKNKLVQIALEIGRAHV